MKRVLYLCGLCVLCGSLLLQGCAPAPHPPALAPVPVPHVQPAPATQPAAPPATQASIPEFVDPRQTVPFLSSDALAGRAPGTPGLVRAGDFLADEFRRIGLQPLPTLGGFFQPFTMPLPTTLGAATLAIDDRPLTVESDFAPLGPSGQGPFAGGVVFAGYGITHDRYDDYAAVNVRGKVVLAMRLEPIGAAGHSRFATGYQRWSPAASVRAKAQIAADRGAVAMLLVSPPSAGGADTLSPFSADADTAPIPVLAVTRRVADIILGMGNAPDLPTLATIINTTGRPRSTPLTSEQITGDLTLHHHSADVRNVIAALPGAGPHADEFVVVGAHYDHLGIGQLGHTIGRPGSIYHGADDNASGIAATLEVAQRMAHAPPPPRSILFCCFTGEEEGLLGSDYFVKHPPVPLNKIVAMLNLDMVGRLKNDNLLVGGWGTAAGFNAIVDAALAHTPLHRQSFEKGGLGPSDHMSFALAHIPVLFYFTGMHADYHRPTDTADKINYAGIDEVAGVCERTTDALATMPRQPYDASSDAGSAMAALMGRGQAGAGKAMLGVVPDFSAFDGGAGVRISGVGDASPAAAAGLRSGDILTRFANQPLTNLQDLSDALAQSKPGDTVEIQLTRNGKPLTVRATLAERGGGE